jgi:hypothetical protein
VLPDWDAALNDMTPDEAWEVLETIDANLRAAGDRMVALGLPTDGRLELEQVASSDDVSDASAIALDMEMDYAGFQTQMRPRRSCRPSASLPPPPAARAAPPPAGARPAAGPPNRT